MFGATSFCCSFVGLVGWFRMVAKILSGLVVYACFVTGEGDCFKLVLTYVWVGWFVIVCCVVFTSVRIFEFFGFYCFAYLYGGLVGVVISCWCFA